jgi:dATP pyrophosphohydrolase
VPVAKNMGISNNKMYAMACVVINNQGKILLLKRSPDKKLAPNKWFVVGAAPLKKSDNMEFIALREIKDELGVKGKILAKMDPVSNDENGLEIVVAPFLAIIDNEEVRLNSEHTEYRWVGLNDLGKYDTIENTELMIRELFKIWKNY